MSTEQLGGIPESSAVKTTAHGAGRDGESSPRRGIYEGQFKPVLDRLGGFVLFVMASPVLALIALIVRAKVGRHVIYKQPRIGKNGDTFELYKFRTMIPDRRSSQVGFNGDDRRLIHKSMDDPRVVPAAKVLRQWRLDELPQFLNVAKGDMSLVGPRPELPEIVEKYEDWQHFRHVVKPGITGPWQVSKRNGNLMHECTDADIEYVESITFRQDLALMLRTPRAMIGRRQGY